jgi:prepilin-type N-terminal cleavage/methylation domain-containing protein
MADNKKDKKGFTLIELLVVVLIIGILAVIALPQYRKSVLNARAAEQITMLRSISNLVKLFILEQGRNPADYSELAAEFPNCSYETRGSTVIITYLSCDKFSSVIETTGKAIFIGPKNSNTNIILGLSQDRRDYVLYMPIQKNEILCIDGPGSPSRTTCADIGFTKPSSQCIWSPCFEK